MADLAWITEKDEIRDVVRRAQRAGKRVGLVPTMGNLHEGHASLFRQAADELDFVIATIFVNPIQFGPGEDFAAYPRTPDDDRRICQEAGVDVVFSPSVETMYPKGACTRVQVVETEKPLCGMNRPGHFVGVATVVTKLFHIIPADVAYFGSKDYQQCKVIVQMVRDLDFPIEIRICPIVRESDGLAMSSRNRYLSHDERKQAAILKKSLDLATELLQSGERSAKRIRQRMRELISTEPLANIDYIEIVDSESLGPIDVIDHPALAALAVRFGRARLIDNSVLVP
jgi:pantoate--beta-alanine ligase